ncbi:MAG: type III PLP-dependent enzyme [Alphaproteobacteria bacterium]
MAEQPFESARAMVAAMTPSYPVYCLRPAVLAQAARRFLEAFPGRVLYAMKCNPHPRVLRALYDAGIRHFDTASLPEIAQVRELFRDAGAYFMHPVKARAVIKTAYEVYGVRHFVVDHERELAKVHDETGGEGVSIIVRLATPHAGAAYDLSTKFGARPALAAELLKEVRREGCQAGVAFHVGSQCLTPRAYRSALALVGEVAEAAKADIHILDVGGGFPAPYLGVDVPPLDDYMTEIEAGVRALDLRRDCVIMAEPGRALVAGGCSLVVQVLLRKDDQIYVNDGIYGSLSEMVTARVQMPVRLIRLDGEPSAKMRDFTVAGPTCDSLDMLPFPFRLAEDVREGDWIEIGQLGAYSSALRTQFNGFYPDTFVELADAPKQTRTPLKVAKG